MASGAIALEPRETERLAEVSRFGLVALEFDERFDRVLRTATRLFDVPSAMITVVTDRTTHIKACIGFDASEIPRAESICDLIVERGEVQHFADLREVAELKDRTGVAGLAFYAGAPVHSPDGHVLGSICVVDTEPRHFEREEREALEDLAGTVTDLLAQQRMERQRDASLERLKIVSEAPNLMIAEVDDRGIIRHISPSVFAMAGYTPSEVEGTFFLDYVHADGRTRLAEDYARAIEGTFVEGHADFVIKDGTTRTLAWSICPATGPDGAPRIVSVLRDVSERVRARHEVEIAKERYRQLFESSRDAMAFTAADRSGRILESNQAFSDFLGYTREEVLEMTMQEMRASPPRAREEMLKRYDDLIQRGFTDDYERNFRTKEGEIVPVSVCAWMLRGPTGEPFAILARLRDLREERRREHERAELQQELEERVHIRTRELEETLHRLKTAERLASVGTLASGVAHQINNPIGAILAAAEFALMSEADANFKDTWRRALMDAVEQSKRCGRIVRSMLQYSRGTRTERWPEDLTLVVPRAIRVAESHNRDEAVRVTFESSASSLPVVMNPIEMQQVLVNLIDNAIESGPRSGIVAVAVRAEAGRAIIDVIDDGRGIREEDRGRVFDPFYTTRQEEGGTGLGLSVADGIVRDLGGRLRIEDAPRGGTRVRIALPLYLESPPPR